MTRALLISSALLTGCTTSQVRDTSAIDAQTARCQTSDCVIDLMDTLPPGDEERYPFMEGSPDTDLQALRRAGKLTADPINPLWYAATVTGYVHLRAHPYGGMESCEIYYTPGFEWASLKHELSHCQGYADHGLPLQVAGYTPAQQAVMAQEGVKHWTDTSVYRERRD